MQVASALSPGTPRPLSDEQYLSGLPAALRAAESLDADSDGASNVEEVIALCLSRPIWQLSAQTHKWLGIP